MQTDPWDDWNGDSDSDLSSSSGSEAPEPDPEPLAPTFRFFDLPGELRERVLEYALHVDEPIDIGLNVVSKIKLLLVSKRFHHEAAAVFYSTNAFRILPTHSRAVERRAKPVLRRVPPRYRAMVTAAELRFGPHWSKPPKCWVVDKHLGLEQMKGLRRLDVFVQADPSDDVYQGFRISRDFYTHLAVEKLRAVLQRLPSVREVHIDHWPGVKRKGPLITALVDEARAKELRVGWGTQRLRPCTCGSPGVCSCSIVHARLEAELLALRLNMRVAAS